MRFSFFSTCAVAAIFAVENQALDLEFEEALAQIEANDYYLEDAGQFAQALAEIESYNDLENEA